MSNLIALNTAFSQAGAYSSNFKIDNVTETEQQLQSLINTAKRMEHFLTSSKIWTMEKSDDVKAKKFDQKSTQTTDHTISKQKAEKVGVVENKAASVITPQTDEGAGTLLSSNANVAEDKFPLPSTSAIDDATVPTNDTNQSQTIEMNQLKNVEVDKAITKKNAYDPFYDEPICKVRQQYTLAKKNEVNEKKYSSDGIIMNHLPKKVFCNTKFFS
uniref:uncharacterized protein LOC120328606 n=1 Tax=Styela clava TaxID=7725 RepID=UPI001939451F|nr:uncharacterized protein LOC120328606 [Styela clava]